MKKDDPDRKMAKDIMDKAWERINAGDSAGAIEQIHNGLVVAFNAGVQQGEKTGHQTAVSQCILEFSRGIRKAIHEEDQKLGLCEPAIVKCLLVNEEISLSRAAELLQISVVEMRERAKEWLNPKT